jgi:hypothetical protein
VLLEEVGVEVGQLDRVADLVDLVLEAADALVGDVRDLLEDELLDLGLRDPLVGVAGAPVEQRRVPERSGSASRTMRSSSALAMQRARSPSARTSLSITTSPMVSNSRAATTLRASLSMTSWPLWSSSRSTEGLTLTRSLRPPVNTSIESSSLRWMKTPKPEGGCASRSTSSLSVTIWSRASRRVWASRSFWAVTAARDRCVSESRCSSSRDEPGASASRRRSSPTSLSR